MKFNNQIKYNCVQMLWKNKFPIDLWGPLVYSNYY